MVTGPVGWLVEAGVPPEVLEFVHAARALNPSTVTAVMVNNVPENRGVTRFHAQFLLPLQA